MSEKTKRLKGSSLYRIVHILCRFIFFTLRRCEVLGAQNIPDGGAFIVAPNHASYIDPPLVGASCGFALNYMAKKELFAGAAGGWLLPRINAFPVDRQSADFGAVRTAAAILASGRPVLVFPEGTSVRNAALKKAPKLGAGFLAAKTQKPVLPVRLINTDKFFSFKPIKVIWGAPVAPPAPNASKEEIVGFTEKLMEKIYSLEAKEIKSLWK